MAEIGTNERLLRSDINNEDVKKLERVLRQNNISYYEKWNYHRGLLSFLNDSKNAKCSIYVHMDSLEKAKRVLGESNM